MRLKTNNWSWPQTSWKLIAQCFPLELCFMGTESAHHNRYQCALFVFLFGTQNTIICVYCMLYVTGTYFSSIQRANLVYIMEIRTMQNSYKEQTRERWVPKRHWDGKWEQNSKCVCACVWVSGSETARMKTCEWVSFRRKTLPPDFQTYCHRGKREWHIGKM